MRLREAACDVRSAGVGIPGYGAATRDAAAELDRVAAELETVDGEQDRMRSRSAVRRSIVAAGLLVAAGVASYSVATGPGVGSSASVETARPTTSVERTDPGPRAQATRQRVCATFAASYPSMSSELRAHGSPPDIVVSPEIYPHRTVHGQATDLAEILNYELGAGISRTAAVAGVVASLRQLRRCATGGQFRRNKRHNSQGPSGYQRSIPADFDGAPANLPRTRIGD